VVLSNPIISPLRQVNVLLYVPITFLLAPPLDNLLLMYPHPLLSISGVLMLDLAGELWRVHRILRMLLWGSVCRVRALRMFLEDMLGVVGTY